MSRNIYWFSILLYSYNLLGCRTICDSFGETEDRGSEEVLCCQDQRPRSEGLPVPGRASVGVQGVVQDRVLQLGG